MLKWSLYYFIKIGYEDNMMNFFRFSKYRELVIFIIDLILVASIYCLTILSLHYNKPVDGGMLYLSVIILLLFNTMFSLSFRVYHSLWRYAEIREFAICTVSSLLAGFSYSVFHWLFLKWFSFADNLLAVCFMAIALVTYRYLYRIYRYQFADKRKSQFPITNHFERILVVGAGSASASMLRELQMECISNVKPVCVVDDDPSKQGRTINCIPISGLISDIPKLCNAKRIDTIYICIPSASPAQRRRILEVCAKTPCRTKILPSYFSKLAYPIDINGHMRTICLEDLLNREVNIADTSGLRYFVENKVVLVTGGGGSIGSELCRQIAGFGAKLLIILDIYENNAYALQQELLQSGISPSRIIVEIASVRDKKKMGALFQYYHPDYVFHAAAHKHVPLMEHNPEEAFKNNVLGTYITANLAETYGVKKFVLISSDKAVRPSSFMGATKRLCEMIIQSKNGGETEFVTVRFGNVLGSNGSVVPLFEQQIKEGGPLTVTHKDITRYFMTIPEAVNLVLHAGSMAKGGDIFVLNMGDPIKIVTLAENMIKMKGYVPYQDIDIVFTGLRPGEKLYEELLLDEEAVHHTKNDRILQANQICISQEEIREYIDRLEKAVETKNREYIFNEMGNIMPNFKNNHYVCKKEEEKRNILPITKGKIILLNKEQNVRESEVAQ
jgi:FlaA1/EpsC-like NDP-sugar epimerase